MNMADVQRLKQEPKYPQFEYTQRRIIDRGLRNGSIIKGPIVVSQKNFKLCFLHYKFDKADEAVTVYVGWRNRAMNGDIVALHLLDRSLYKVSEKSLKEYLSEKGFTLELPTHHTGPKADAGAKGKKKKSGPPPHMCYLRLGELRQSNVYSKLMRILREDYPTLTSDQGLPDKFLQPVGAVVGIIEEIHDRRAYGRIEEIPDNTAFVQLLPFDRRVPKINIHISSPLLQGFFDDPDQFADNVYIARITEWKERSVNFAAKGKLVEYVGERTDIETMTTINLVQKGIDYDDEYGELSDVEQYEQMWTIPDSEYTKRRDFTEECVFTVDPASAVDLDDALSCKQISEDEYEVSVHIVDAAYFVNEGSDIDECAKNRATTIYKTQNTAYPMLPKSLSKERCSLNPYQSRLTVSLVWRMDGQGNIKPGSEWIGRGIVKPCVRLSYHQAQDLMDRAESKWDLKDTPQILEGFSLNDVKTRVIILNKIAKQLRQRRVEAGMLQFGNKEFHFEKDDSGSPTDILTRQDASESQQMVEEFMAITNVAVARKIYKELPTQALLKRQPVPGSDRLNDLESQARSIGLDIDVSNVQSIQRSLDGYKEASVDEESEGRYLVVTKMCQRKLMQKAEYFCAGMYDDPEMYRHFALNAPVYTHFTSPLRKYADLTVHRQLLAALGCSRDNLGDTEATQSLAKELGIKEATANHIEKDGEEMSIAAWLTNCGPQTEKAVISAVHDRSVEVIFLRFGYPYKAGIDVKRLELTKELEYDDTSESPALTLQWPGGVSQTLRALDLVDCELKATDDLRCFHVNLKKPFP